MSGAERHNMQRRFSGTWALGTIANTRYNAAKTPNYIDRHPHCFVAKRVHALIGSCIDQNTIGMCDAVETRLVQYQRPRQLLLRHLRLCQHCRLSHRRWRQQLRRALRHAMVPSW